MTGVGHESFGGRVAAWLVQVASRLVPSDRRQRWEREWRSELWHRERDLVEAGAGHVRLTRRLVGPAMGAIVHAVWLRSRNTGFDSVRQDISFAIRASARSPAFTGAVVLTLGLGLATNVAVFAVVDGALARSFPYEDSDRLAVIVGRAVDRPDEPLLLAFPEIEALGESGVLESIAAFDWDPFNLRLADGTRWVGGGLVTASLFSTLGLEPIRGRFFMAGEDGPGAPAVVILGEALWRSAFGARDVVGETVWLDGNPHEVIGVAPASMDIPEGAELWVPLRPTGAAAGMDTRWLQSYGRLAPGVSRERAGTVLAALAARLADEYPASNEGRTFEAVSLRDHRIGGARSAFVALILAVGLLLLIVCANVASLYLARSARRSAEFGMRHALGASRTRIARQLMTESLVVVVAAGGLGIMLAYWMITLLTRTLPERPVWFDPSFGLSTVLITMALVFACSILFGLAPLLSGSAAGPATGLRSGRSTTIRSNDVLVFSEVVLSTVLMVGSVMLVRSLSRTLNVDPGFEARNLIAGTIQLPGGRFDDDDAVVGFATRFLDTIESQADVESVGAVTRMPFRSGVNQVMWWENGQGDDAFRENPQAELNSVTPGYFTTMGIGLVAGRTISDADRGESADVVVIGETFAREYFADRDPLGARISFQYPPRFVEVVGVVEDVKHQGLDQAARFQIYAPFAQRPTRRLTVVVRGKGQPAALADAVRGILRRLDPDLALSELRPVEDTVRQSVWRLRLLTQVFWVCAIFAVMMVSVGIAGIVGQAVARRTRELGIRIALGAGRRQILGLVGRRTGSVLVAGLATGIAASLAAGRFTAHMLFGVDAGDPVTYGLVVIGFLLVASIAAWLPARRAMAIDPVRSLSVD